MLSKIPVLGRLFRGGAAASVDLAATASDLGTAAACEHECHWNRRRIVLWSSS